MKQKSDLITPLASHQTQDKLQAPSEATQYLTLSSVLVTPPESESLWGPTLLLSYLLLYPVYTAVPSTLYTQYSWDNFAVTVQFSIMRP